MRIGLVCSRVTELPGFRRIGAVHDRTCQVSCDIRPGRASDGFLVDAHDPADSGEVPRDGTLQLFGLIGEQHFITVGHWLIRLNGASEVLTDQSWKNLADETGFT